MLPCGCGWRAQRSNPTPPRYRGTSNRLGAPVDLDTAVDETIAYCAETRTGILAVDADDQPVELLAPDTAQQACRALEPPGEQLEGLPASLVRLLRARTPQTPDGTRSATLYAATRRLASRGLATLQVEASIRTLILATGHSYDGIRDALTALQDAGWAQRKRVGGARWQETDEGPVDDPRQPLPADPPLYDL